MHLFGTGDRSKRTLRSEKVGNHVTIVSVDEVVQRNRETMLRVIEHLRWKMWTHRLTQHVLAQPPPNKIPVRKPSADVGNFRIQERRAYL